MEAGGGPVEAPLSDRRARAAIRIEAVQRGHRTRSRKQLGNFAKPTYAAKTRTQSPASGTDDRPRRRARTPGEDEATGAADEQQQGADEVPAGSSALGRHAPAASEPDSKQHTGRKRENPFEHLRTVRIRLVL